MAGKSEKHISSHQFSTFGGVFTPSILTILGVIMFMRANYVIGISGVTAAVLILVFAKSVTFLTSLSISAISTNTRIKGGGAYYMISRSLGPEFGGSIGIALYLAQALSVPFYILGFVEALVITFPALSDYFLILTVSTLIFLTVINYIGADWAIKVQYIIMAILLLSIAGFMLGAILKFEPELFKQNIPSAFSQYKTSFFEMFAIYFPSVTGIMAGVNMSGDLKDPKRSIPRGIIYAILAGFLIYLLQILLVSGAYPREELIKRPYETLVDLVPFGLGFLVSAGVISATLSSGVGSLMGAPRIIQALARDKIFKLLEPLGAGSKTKGEPRRAIILTFVLSLIVLIQAGNGKGGRALNIVAEVISMIFLYSYGLTNLAAFIEAASGNPSFRPTFKYFHWSTALIGAVLCWGITFLINPFASFASLVFIAAIYAVVKKKVLSSTFGDARMGFYYARVRNTLFKLWQIPHHPKNWRPIILVLSGNPETRMTLINYANWFESKRGIITLAQIIQGRIPEKLEERKKSMESLRDFIKNNGLAAFPEVVVAPEIDEALAILVQAHSIGPLKPNLLLMGWPKRIDRASPMVTLLHQAAVMNISTAIVVDKGCRAPFMKEKRIDVWWRGMKNGSLMMILAYLLSTNWEWRDAKIRVLREVGNKNDYDSAEKELKSLVEAARIDASVNIILSQKPFKDVLFEHSRKSAVVFLGFNLPDKNGAEDFFNHYNELLIDNPTTILVYSNGEADLLA